jgi:hypothetical protein
MGGRRADRLGGLAWASDENENRLHIHVRDRITYLVIIAEPHIYETSVKYTDIGSATLYMTETR